MWTDAHHHVWDPTRRPQPWMDPTWPINRPFDADDLAAAARGTPVSSSIVVQTTPRLDETIDLLDLAHANPSVTGVVGWLDLLTPLSPQLDALSTSEGIAHLVGIRHQAEDEHDQQWLARDDVGAAIRQLGRYDLAFDLLVRPHQLQAAITLARATATTTRLVLNHCGKPPIGDDLTTWRSRFNELAGFDHVACKLSGLVTEANWSRWTHSDLEPVAHAALDAFGPERLMFGSDWPVCLLAASYAEVVTTAKDLTARLSRSERAAIFSGTARKWYRLPSREEDRC